MEAGPYIQDKNRSYDGYHVYCFTRNPKPYKSLSLDAQLKPFHVQERNTPCTERKHMTL